MRKTLLTAALFLGLTGSLTLQAQSNAPIDYTPIAPDDVDLQLSTLRADGSLDISKLDLGNIDLGAIAGNLGGMLENSPLGGIAEGLGGLFGKK